MSSQMRHPVNRRLFEEASSSERLAIAVTEFLGSWRFIALQTVIVAAWIAGNVYLVFRFDPYPFVFLNLAFSTQAAYAAPLILLSGNRASARDRLTLEHAARKADHEEQQNDQLLRANAELAQRLERLERRLVQSEVAIVAAVNARGRRS